LRLRLIAEADGCQEKETLEDEESAHEGGINRRAVEDESGNGIAVLEVLEI